MPHQPGQHRDFLEAGAVWTLTRLSFCLDEVHYLLLLVDKIDDGDHNGEKRAERDDGLSVHGRTSFRSGAAQEVKHRSRDSISRKKLDGELL